MPVSALFSEFCTVKILVGLKNLSASWNSEVPAFGSNLNYCINSASIGMVKWPCKHNDHYREMFVEEGSTEYIYTGNIYMYVVGYFMGGGCISLVPMHGESLVSFLT